MGQVQRFARGEGHDAREALVELKRAWRISAVQRSDLEATRIGIPPASASSAPAGLQLERVEIHVRQWRFVLGERGQVLDAAHRECRLGEGHPPVPAGAGPRVRRT